MYRLEPENSRALELKNLFEAALIKELTQTGANLADSAHSTDASNLDLSPRGEPINERPAVPNEHNIYEQLCREEPVSARHQLQFVSKFVFEEILANSADYLK